ncbi:KAP family P-loop NTPase fold protein [Vibrio cholerae]
MSKDNRFISWKEEYSWDACKLKNGDYGRFLSSYLRNQKTPLVLNLDGGWGTGKTTFLRQLYCDLAYTHKFPCIYIDAWESDYSNDPLLVIISELLEQLKRVNKQFEAADTERKILATLGKFGKKVWNTTAIGLGTYVSGQTDNSAFVEFAKQFTFSDAEAAVLGGNLSSAYKQQKLALNDAREALETLVEFCPEGHKKVFVLIDELDRCRPNYAIEMLETIKHFFELENYVFVIATDTDQLSHSIQAIYGANFDGREYLSRFFYRTAKLPEPNRYEFCRKLVDSLTDDSFDKLISINNNDAREGIFLALIELGQIYNLSLRRIEQTFNKFESILAFFKTNVSNVYFDVNVIITLLMEYDSTYFNCIYKERKKAIDFEIRIPPSISQESKTDTDNPILHAAIISMGRGQYQTCTDLASKYNTSWLVATQTPKHNNVGEVISRLKTYVKMNSFRQGIKDNKYIEQYESCLLALQAKNHIAPLATLGDYYKYVELAQTK